MEFYSAISEYYDHIFPIKKATLDFLEKANIGGPILDVACASGGYSIELAKKGYKVLGLDLDHEMIVQANEKLSEASMNKVKDLCTFQVMNMLHIANQLDLHNHFNQVYCIGNSIVHLTSDEQVRQALLGFNKVLRKGGRLVIQTINFDRVLDQQVTSLPTIINDQVPLSFQRDYYLDKKRGLISFLTRLKVREDIDISNEVSLNPIRSKKMIELLEETGFTNIKLYGNFLGEAYDSKNSYPMIIDATK